MPRSRHTGYVGRHRARTLVRASGLRARCRRKFIHTTDSRHTLPVAANVLDRQFKPNAPNRAWVPMRHLSTVRRRTMCATRSGGSVMTAPRRQAVPHEPRRSAALCGLPQRRQAQ